MLPFKFGGSTPISIVIYSIAGFVLYFCLSNGGMENAGKLVLSKK
jgi:hypothetical protein